jgi:hypothetical protein
MTPNDTSLNGPATVLIEEVEQQPINTFQQPINASPATILIEEVEQLPQYLVEEGRRGRRNRKKQKEGGRRRKNAGSHACISTQYHTFNSMQHTVYNTHHAPHSVCCSSRSPLFVSSTYALDTS